MRALGPVVCIRFNPRARGGRDRAARVKSLFNAVSIHAPAGGATKWICNNWKADNVSIHAPAGGATDLFQFCVGVLIVSIHAPAGGATKRLSSE